MVRLVAWRLVLAAAMALAMISSPGIHAQEAGTVTAANPEATVAAAVDTAAPATEAPTNPVATEAAATEAVTTSPPAVTEAATTIPPVATNPAPTEAAVTEAAVTEAPATSTPTETTPPVTEAATVSPTATAAPVNTDPPTTATPTTAPATSQVALDSSATILQDTSFPSIRSASSSSTSSQSSASKSASETTTGTLDGNSSTKTIVICSLGGVGAVIILSLLFVVWRSRKREDPDLDTPLPDTATITFPTTSMPSIVAPTGQDLNAWKATGSSYASRDPPLTESARAKLNATTRSSAEYDLANRSSQIASLSAHVTPAQTPQADRETNASSEQRFSIRGFSEFSVHQAGDSETSAMNHDRYSTSDRYSTCDRYSTTGRYSTSSRLSSEVSRSNSGWFQNQVPKSLDMNRFSSTSSTASSVVARKHNPVPFINHDLTQTPGAEAPVTTDSTTSRTDVPDWYSVIESPTDNDRYTTSSLDSDNISEERESFEL